MVIRSSRNPEIAPGELAAERSDYPSVGLAERLRQAPVRLNPPLPPEALDDLEPEDMAEAFGTPRKRFGRVIVGESVKRGPRAAIPAQLVANCS